MSRVEVDAMERDAMPSLLAGILLAASCGSGSAPEPARGWQVVRSRTSSPSEGGPIAGAAGGARRAGGARAAGGAESAVEPSDEGRDERGERPHEAAPAPAQAGKTATAPRPPGPAGMRKAAGLAVGSLPLDSNTLPDLMRRAGFVPPERFKALVVEYIHDEDGRWEGRAYDFEGTSKDREDWWPASSVKLFAAVAALETLRAMGFDPSATVTYHYEKDPVTRKVEWLVREAITPSNNTAFDQLVEIVGFDRMNAWFREKGLNATVLLRGYSGRVRDPRTRLGTLRESAALTIEQDGVETRDLPARHGSDRGGCPDQGNCTTLQDLAEVLRRVMMHDLLPAGEQLRLDPRDIKLLRSALEADRERGQNVVVGLREAFGERPVRLFHKPGFANNWFSDAVYVLPRYGKRQWIVAMAGFPGRQALDGASRIVGRILAEGGLARAAATGE